ncbi:FMN-binding negative transcriptional regulator [Nakamurella sp. YIM 132087]|uniref:FMN-binding negative transcriptional regulator n=1 Tax=Nakamurella alba TaxID=2665158 RepID=A0A7K1FM18_9ACTN|nr:FMN-binding negative transcriptional regulator [Nakamurella alba]MTD15202.1 FMN-binding negative transcriptional regulator [Nakamurella alba]
MYIPHFNAVHDEDAIRGFVGDVGSAELITVGPDGFPLATLLPVLWHGDTVIAHMAKANPQWRTIGTDTPALMVVAGPQAYVSPSWYATKAEHGRVVPTWNYSAVHLTGTATLHTEPEWLRHAVTALTDRHEERREAPWSVDDTPAGFVDKQLRAIVGIELTVVRVEAKDKLSQNRSDDDRIGVLQGLSESDDPRDVKVAERMARVAHPG